MICPGGGGNGRPQWRERPPTRAQPPTRGNTARRTAPLAAPGIRAPAPLRGQPDEHCPRPGAAGRSRR
eukprot:15477147-Alexandrium_andersonii.AAC.1